MSESQHERRNPFYILLIVAGFAFVLTALAYAVVPELEKRASQAGSSPPPSPLRDSLRHDGWIWLLIEGGIVIVLSLLSMAYDRLLRTLKKAPPAGTIPAEPPPSPSSTP